MKRIYYFFLLFLIVLTPVTSIKAQEGDITPPRFLDITVGEPTESSISISWKTDENTTGKILYGPTTSYEYSKSVDNLTNVHIEELTNLKPNTHYHMIIKAVDSSNNTTESQDFYFTTTGDALIPPNFIGEIAIAKESENSIRISFETDTDSSSFIEYGQNESYGSNYEDLNFIKIHNYLIEGLTSNVTYNFRITIRNQSGTTMTENIQFLLQSDSSTDTLSPEAIDDLEVESVGNNFVNLAWNRPNDNTGVIAYDVRYSKNTITETNVDESAILNNDLFYIENITEQNCRDSASVSGLAQNTLYYFIVRSMDSYRNMSSISNMVSTTTSLTDTGGGTDEQCEDNTTRSGHSHIIKEIPATTFGPATNVRAGALDSEIHIFWQNPNSTDFLKTKIVRKESSYPNDENDGVLVYEGQSQTFVDNNVVNEKTYYYKLFTISKTLSTSIPVQFSISPRGGIHRLHFITENKTGMTIKLTKNFKLGDRDHEITHIQELLATDPSIYPEGLTTGYFGLLTQKAVIRFQEKNNLITTGEINTETREKITETLKTQSITNSPFEVGVISFEQNLKLGMKENNVRYLQEFLIKEGLFPENLVSGFFGPITMKAVIAFQQKNNILPATGYVGLITRTKIIESLSK